MSLSLEASYRHCEAVTKERAKNFYYGIKLLPKQRRQALCAIYAFFRYCDDVSDGDIQGDRRDLLTRWRASVEPQDLDGSSSLILPGYYQAVRDYKIPTRYFYELIDGVESDLSTQKCQNFDELYRYCYQVASTVGLVCVHVFGFDGSEEALLQAEHRGIAFQLTNVLRDISEDLERGRVYLPLDELDQFGVSVERLIEKKPEEGFGRFLDFQIERAREYYKKSAGLPAHVDAESRASLEAMTSIYSQLLDKVAKLGPKVLHKRASLSLAEKVKLAGQLLLS